MTNSTTLKAIILVISVFVPFYTTIFGQDMPCHVIHDGIDLQTKIYRVEIEPALLFNYTPPEVKADLQEDNLMVCQAQIVKKDDKTSLHMNLKMHSLKAQDLYGSIDQGNSMTLTLIDGKEVKLNCFAGSKGVQPKNKKFFIYPIGFELSNRDIKQLVKKEIDKIGIQWSSGYEEYTIYEIDFFMNQLTCLQKVAGQKPN